MFVSRILAVLAVAIAVLAPPAHAAPAPRIVGVAFEQEGKSTRVRVTSDRHLDFQIRHREGAPPQIEVEFPRVRWSVAGLTSEAGKGEGDGVVARYRYEHNSATTSRLVLELAGPAVVVRSRAIEAGGGRAAHGVELDISRATPARFAEKSGAAAPTAAPVQAARQPARKPLVVIDAGHGGKDPGALAADGVREKDLTLAAALALRDALIATGRYEVGMTRASDVFIELDERVTRARNLKADLFISLHADAGGKPNVRGASVYTLSTQGEARAEAMRARQDWVMDVETDTSRPEMVNQILADLVQRDTKNQSARFANMLIPALGDAGWPLLRNTHRNAGLYVLLAPDVPAVLLEMGFVSHGDDVKLLASTREQRRLAKGIVSAIDAFFAESPLRLAQH